MCVLSAEEKNNKQRAAAYLRAVLAHSLHINCSHHRRTVSGLRHRDIEIRMGKMLYSALLLRNIDNNRVCAGHG